MYYSFRILQLRENGILDKLVHKHFGMLKNQVCAPDHHVAQSTLSVEDVWPVFVVLGAGLALSIIVLLIEHIWSMIMDVCTLLFSVKKNWHSKSGSSYLKCTIICLSTGSKVNASYRNICMKNRQFSHLAIAVSPRNEMESSGHAWLDGCNFQQKRLLAPTGYRHRHPADENIDDAGNLLE